MSRRTTGEALARQLFAAESAIDGALTETAALMAMLPSARIQFHLSAVTGQRAFDGAAGAISALTEARSRMVATHNALSVLAKRVGLDDLAIGPLDKPEDTPPIGDGPRPRLAAHFMDEIIETV